MGFALFPSPILDATKLYVYYAAEMLLRKVWKLNTQHASENICYFVNTIGACFSLAQNSEHDPMRNYATNSLIFNYNLLTNQE
jgi:hypothetical protein